MNIKKRVLAKLEMVYAVSSMTIENKLYLIAATEKKGKCLLFSPPDWKKSEIWQEPGGTMSIVPFKKTAGFFAIQKFYPVFKSEEARIVYVRPGIDIAKNWDVKIIGNLPYVHRIELINSNKENFLIASTLCQEKKFVDDWSMPGAVFIYKITDDFQDKFADNWKPEIILNGITKNHGMYVNNYDNKKVILISGKEGVFEIKVPGYPWEKWQSGLAIKEEVSDLCMFDIDGDGKKELITIKPFHGDTVAIYKNIKKTWQIVYRDKINFGHVVWGGKILGESCIILSNRGGNKELKILRLKKIKPLIFDEEIIDEGVGATQISTIEESNTFKIISANHSMNEVVLYEIDK